MKVTAERLPQSKVLLRIEIPPEQVEEAIDRTYRDISRRIRVPGFRPGRAPRPLVERYLGGPQVIQEEGIERLINDSFRQALRETDIHPIGEADIAARPEFRPGEPLIFEAAVPVAPTVELGDYQSIRLQPVAVEATAEQVNQAIDALREERAEWVSVDRGAREGDRVLIDVKGTVGAVPTLYGPGGETVLHTTGGRVLYNEQKHEHLINPRNPPEFAPGFDEELIGLTPGSEKRFGLTLPADVSDPSLANQSIVFEVKVHEVKEKHLPPLDDEFARAVGGGDTLESLRETVRREIQARLEREARRAYEETLLQMVVERSTVDIPEIMIERQIDAQIEEIKGDLAAQRISWEEYLRALHLTPERVREQERERAVRRLRNTLVLDQIAEREHITVSPSEVTAEIEAMAAQFGPAARAIRERLNTREQREQIESRLRMRKAIARLVEIAQQPAPDTAASPEESPAASAEAPTDAALRPGGEETVEDSAGPQG
ncbi:MAG TPA: trigger factor [Chloroflexota bacterium]|nr:trigger factor [Chloroflexota bacterium]